MNNKVFAYIGFALRKNCIIYGCDGLISSDRMHPHVVFIDKSSGRSTMRETINYCKKKEIPLFLMPNEQLEKYCCKKCKVLTITDKNLSNAIINELNENPDMDFEKYTEVQPIDND